MNLDPVIQIEVTQEEKNKCHISISIYLYIYYRKMVLINLLAGQQ